MLRYLTVLLVATSVQASVTFQQAQSVWAKLCNTSGHHVSLCYDDDLNSNAYSNLSGVCINQGLLNDIQNIDQLAMVLGHEMSHTVLKHYLTKQSKVNELAADKLGFYYCKKLGYTKCKSFFTLMRTMYGEEGKDGVHPTWTYRLKRLTK